MTQHTSSDCRTEEGICVGLIDGIIAMARVLCSMTDYLGDEAVTAALEDLRTDESLNFLLPPREVLRELNEFERMQIALGRDAPEIIFRMDALLAEKDAEIARLIQTIRLICEWPDRLPVTVEAQP